MNPPQSGEPRTVPTDDPDAMLAALRALGFPTLVEPTGNGKITPAQAAQIAGTLHVITEVSALRHVSDGHAPSVANGMMAVLIQAHGGDPYVKGSVTAQVTAQWMVLLSERLEMMREQIENTTVADSSPAVPIMLDALRVAGSMTAFTAMAVDGDLNRDDADKLTCLMVELLQECADNVGRLRAELMLDGGDHA